MKRKLRPVFRRVPPVLLHLEDLQAIVSILKETGPNVTISTRENEYDNLEELKATEANAELNYMLLRTVEEKVWVELKPDNAWVHSHDDTTEQRGVVDKIRSQLLARKRPFRAFLSHPLLTLLFMCSFLGSFWVISSGFKTGLVHWKILSIALTVTLLTLGAVSQGWNQLSYSTIRIRSESESSSFWKRKGDDVLVRVVSGLVGAVIGAIITLAIMAISKAL